MGKKIAVLVRDRQSEALRMSVTAPMGYRRRMSSKSGAPGTGTPGGVA